mgnify:CR=1 FL=1
MIEKNNFNEIEGKEILNKLFNKELNSKKNILEAIEIIRPLAKEELKGEKLQEIYNIIYNSIEDMNTIVKANTIMYLKNQLKSALGKIKVWGEGKFVAKETGKGLSRNELLFRIL